MNLHKKRLVEDAKKEYHVQLPIKKLTQKQKFFIKKLSQIKNEVPGIKYCADCGCDIRATLHHLRCEKCWNKQHKKFGDVKK